MKLRNLNRNIKGSSQALEKPSGLRMNEELPGRGDYHLPRRIFHMVNGALIVGVSFLFERKLDFLIFMSLGTVAWILVEAIRLRSAALNALAVRIFGPVMRKGEMKRFSGFPYYCLGVTISYLFFPLPIAVLAVLFLAFGDPIASVVGTYFRKKELSTNLHDNKSLEGSLACGLFCFFLSLGIAPSLFDGVSYGGFHNLSLAMAGGLSAALAELLPMRTDDNLSMPLISGALLWLFAAFIGVLPGLISNV